MSCRVTQDGWFMVESYNEMWSTGVWVSEVCCLVQLFATPWTVAHQVPLSMGFFRQEYWSGLPLSSPRNLLTQGLNLGLLHCRQTFFFFLIIWATREFHWRRKWQTISVFLPWEPMNSMKRQKETTLKAELPRLVGALYATGEEWRNSSRKNEGAPVHRVTKSQNWTWLNTHTQHSFCNISLYQWENLRVEGGNPGYLSNK